MMPKKLFLFCMAVLLAVSAHAKELKPQYTLAATHMVTDLVLDGSRLYAATFGGSVNIFDIGTRQLVGEIKLPMIRDFMGDEVPPKIYSIDKLGDRLMMVSEGKSGYRNVHIYDGKTLTQIIDYTQQFFIKKGLFVDEDHLLLGLLSSEIILYEISSGKVVYRKAIKQRRSGGSAFSDMVLSEDKKRVATADESGEIYLFNVADFTRLKKYAGQNVDNIYKIDFRHDIVITAGQDRRCAVYKPDGSAYHLDAEFLIYAAALNASATMGVYAATIENDLQLFDIRTKEKGAVLKGHNATLTDFAFTSETAFFSSGEEKNIYFWETGN